MGSLPQGSKPEELRRLFENYGVVTECDIMNRCGFVHMQTQESAEAAIEALNQTNFKGATICVERGRMKERNAGGGGGDRNRNRQGGNNNRDNDRGNRGGSGGGGAMRRDRGGNNMRGGPYNKDRNMNRGNGGGGGNGQRNMRNGGGGGGGMDRFDRGMDNSMPSLLMERMMERGEYYNFWLFLSILLNYFFFFKLD